MFSQDGLIFESQTKPVKEVKFSPFQDTQEVERWGRSIWLVDSTIVDMDEVRKEVKLASLPEWVFIDELDFSPQWPDVEAMLADLSKKYVSLEDFN